MKTYYLLMIDNFKFIVHDASSSLQVTQQEEGSITNIVAIFKATSTCNHWKKIDDFNEVINEVIYINPTFTQGAYKNKINNFLTK